MKYIYTLIILFLVNSSYAQSLQETINWISINTNGKQQVSYDKSENKLIFMSINQDGYYSIYVREINPNVATSVSTQVGDNNWNTIIINFNSVHNVKYYTLDENQKLKGKVNSVNMYGLDISIESNKDMLERLKKAYIHLFNTIGVNVKDGDFF